MDNLVDEFNEISAAISTLIDKAVEFLNLLTEHITNAINSFNYWLFLRFTKAVGGEGLGGSLSQDEIDFERLYSDWLDH